MPAAGRFPRRVPAALPHRRRLPGQTAPVVLERQRVVTPAQFGQRNAAEPEAQQVRRLMVSGATRLPPIVAISGG